LLILFLSFFCLSIKANLTASPNASATLIPALADISKYDLAPICLATSCAFSVVTIRLSSVDPLFLQE